MEVVKPFASEKCSEVLAAVFSAESVLVGSVGVGLFEVRYKCKCVKTFNGFREDGSEVNCAVIGGVAGGFFLVQWCEPVFFPGCGPGSVSEYRACE